MKKLKNWLERNRDGLLFGGIAILAALLALSIAGNIIFIGISNDLVDRVNKEVKEKEAKEKTGSSWGTNIIMETVLREITKKQ